jgi:methanethiol oxidase
MASIRHASLTLSALAACVLLGSLAHGDETCNSPYLAKLIKGQEDYVYVWTLGVEALGDGSDKLVTVDVNPQSKRFGKVIHTVSVGARAEAHHMGFTDDRRHLWAGGLDDSGVHVFDIFTDPAKPRLVKSIKDFPQKTGFIGPHTFYPLPGRMLIQALSNTQDKGGKTGMALYNNKGEFVAKYDIPTGGGGDGYGYDIRVNPKKNVLLSSSFTGWNNYMRPIGELIKDEAAMKRFGNTMVVWDLKAMQPKKVLAVPGTPLEIRWSLNPADNWAITSTALTSKLWLVKPDAKGEWQAKEVADIGDPAKTPLPVDISITADGKGLWVSTFMDGTAHYFDLSNPEQAKQVYEKKIGSQVNMISQSWDGKRVYFTSSLLANWDKQGPENEQYLKLFHWNGKELEPAFAVDFTTEKLGRPHHMALGSKAAKAAYGPQAVAHAK